MKKLGYGTHEAYAYVKSRSPWIGPNMSLIYQLTDYARLVNPDRNNPATNKLLANKTNISAPSTAPLDSVEAKRYKDSPSPVPSAQRIIRPNMARTKSEGRNSFLEVAVEKVAETMSSPRFG